jgi:hypothetical protein
MDEYYVTKKLNILHICFSLFLSVVAILFLTQCQFSNFNNNVGIRHIEQKYGYQFSKHALDRMHQRQISYKEICDAIGKGQKYNDTDQGSYIFHDFYSNVNVILKNKCIVTVYRGPVKSRWRIKKV